MQVRKRIHKNGLQLVEIDCSAAHAQCKDDVVEKEFSSKILLFSVIFE